MFSRRTTISSEACRRASVETFKLTLLEQLVEMMELELVKLIRPSGSEQANSTSKSHNKNNVRMYILTF